MKVENVNTYDVVVNTVRNIRSSFVEVQFKQNDITIKAGMRCERSLNEERKTQGKILKYLGFNDFQIKELDYG